MDEPADKMQIHGLHGTLFALVAANNAYEKRSTRKASLVEVLQHELPHVDQLAVEVVFRTHQRGTPLPDFVAVISPGARGFQVLPTLLPSICPGSPRRTWVTELALSLRWQASALDCLQEATEAFLLDFFSYVASAAAHAKPVTVKPVDHHLVCRFIHFLQ
ncbi:unnamed protein product [Mesocestoides corti]|uniref:Core Histone H2A/H2B/H3 domain-containing protein n=1 Tax=Mesocestoides corti TaxID=53468 RepID=A0A0R3UB61_MESCO|nr:unnamed protein product [Mesocestoides corti]